LQLDGSGAVFRHGLEARVEPRLGVAAGGIGEGPGLGRGSGQFFSVKQWERS